MDINNVVQMQGANAANVGAVVGNPVATMVILPTGEFVLHGTGNNEDILNVINNNLEDNLEIVGNNSNAGSGSQ